MQPSKGSHCLLVCGVAVGIILAAGCATTIAPPKPSVASDPIGQEPQEEIVPVARYGRYTLVELAPGADQRNLLQQTVEVSLPPGLDANVGDAMRHALLRSGYRLCDSVEAAPLYDLPLPAAHLHLGPLTLRDALLILAGSAWELSVDESNRQVCFHAVRASETAP